MRGNGLVVLLALVLFAFAAVAGAWWFARHRAEQQTAAATPPRQDVSTRSADPTPSAGNPQANGRVAAEPPQSVPAQQASAPTANAPAVTAAAPAPATSPIRAPAALQEFERGLLWRVEKGGAAPSFVFGTIHVADPRVTQLPPAVASAFEGAKSFAMEAVLDIENSLKFAQATMLSDGRDLESLAGPELFAKTERLMQSYGVPHEVLRTMKPWAVMAMLSLPQSGDRAALDMQLYQSALERGKPVHGLETIEEQIEVFEGLPMDAQLALLSNTVDQYDAITRMTGRVIDAYLARDLAAIRRINEQMQVNSSARGEDKLLMKRALGDRNPRMVERMCALIDAGGAFIAVGALHLPGEGGVLSLLARQGYRLSRVY